MVPGNGTGSDGAAKLWNGVDQDGVPKAKAGAGLPLVAGHQAVRIEVAASLKITRHIRHLLAAGTRRIRRRHSTSGVAGMSAATLDGPEPAEHVGASLGALAPRGAGPPEVHEELADALQELNHGFPVSVTIAQNSHSIEQPS